MTADLFLFNNILSNALKDIKCTVNTTFNEFEFIDTSLSAQIILAAEFKILRHYFQSNLFFICLTTSTDILYNSLSHKVISLVIIKALS